MKLILLIAFITTLSVTGFAQNKKYSDKTENSQGQKYSYAYIAIQGKIFSKKLKVEVDFGDSPEQIKAGEEYSEILTNKKSYAAILNHMVENQFELVETLDYTSSYNGSGGTSGIVFIMKKKNN